MSDEEVVDPKATLEVSCKPKCVRQLKEYQFMDITWTAPDGNFNVDKFSLIMRHSDLNREKRICSPRSSGLAVFAVRVFDEEECCFKACTKRIEGDESGHKHCTGQYFDYWHCIDKCVAAKLFDHLK